MPWEADARAHQIFLSEWSTWSYHCHLIRQSSAALGSQAKKPCFPVPEMHFLKTQTHTSTSPPAWSLRASTLLAHLACCLHRVCSGDSSFKLFDLLAIGFMASSMCLLRFPQVQFLGSIRVSTWSVSHYHRISFWNTRINVFPKPCQWACFDMDSCGFPSHFEV